MSSSRTTRVSVEDLQKDAQAFSGRSCFCLYAYLTDADRALHFTKPAWHDELDQSFETDPSSISDAIARCFEILVTTRQSFGDSARDASIAKTAETIFTQIDSVLKSFQTGDTLSQLNEDEGNKLKAVKKTYRQVKRDYEVLKARRTGSKYAKKNRCGDTLSLREP